MSGVARLCGIVFAVAAVAALADSCGQRSPYWRHLAECPRCGFVPSEPGEFAPPLTDCPEMQRISWEYAAAGKGGRR